MLRKIRITLSILLSGLITLYFLDFAELLPQSLHWLAKIQFLPALLAMNIAVLAGLVLLTVIFGRVYCSSICPMGVYQDLVAWFSKRLNRKKKYTHSKAKTVLRWGILGITVIAFLFGFSFLLGLLDPYGAYGRIVTHLFRPAYMAGNNLMATIFALFHSTAFYKVGIYVLGVFSTVLALATLVFIGLLAWKNGRTYCNTVCPVGTTLGFISRISIFKIRIVEENCNKCGRCSTKCKASCIDSEKQQIDYSRCVSCFNCIDSCKRKALRYTPLKPKASPAPPHEKETPPTDEARRRFLSATLITGIAAGKMLAQETADGLLQQEAVNRETPIAPPGAVNFDRLREKCISCHLCVSKCPSRVIKPAFLEYGLGGMMQPRLYFDHGFCNYDCTICGEVCPSGALVPLSKEEKNRTQTGQVHFVLANCIVYRDETNCGACSEHCPTQAVSMVPYKDSLTIPHTDPAICVGCGGCEYVCPTKPHKAIYVKGLKSQNTIEIEEEKQEDIELEGFGF
ncbi:MAG: 4Fe-4S dicluster domain-containing protein [Dysgonamonadaceae bacterium]|jgi:ferredoxin|nr:4Fe-4S dicluster domain-containing protein [Dysgonamonadaceae bacterium]